MRVVTPLRHVTFDMTRSLRLVQWFTATAGNERRNATKQIKHNEKQLWPAPVSFWCVTHGPACGVADRATCAGRQRPPKISTFHSGDVSASSTCCQSVAPTGERLASVLLTWHQRESLAVNASGATVRVDTRNDTPGKIDSGTMAVLSLQNMSGGLWYNRWLYHQMDEPNRLSKTRL